MRINGLGVASRYNGTDCIYRRPGCTYNRIKSTEQRCLNEEMLACEDVLLWRINDA